MTKKSITDIVATIVDELSALTSDERQRVVQASLMLLGEQNKSDVRIPDSGLGHVGGEQSLPVRATMWMKQNGLSLAQLDQVFHFGDEGVDVIAAEIPGKNNREKVRNTYVLLGISRLLASGEAKFEDKAARALCEISGFYDHTNHVKYMKGGNEFTGSKDKGWVLTAPGLKQGAILVSALGEKA